MKTTRGWNVGVGAAACLLGLVFAGELAAQNETYNQFRARDQVVYQEYRQAKRRQVRELTDVWFADWRPSAVGRTYIDLADALARLDLKNCSPALRKHVGQAERATTQVAELFGHGNATRVNVLLGKTRVGAGVDGSERVSAARGRRVMELLRELEYAEENVVRELGLDD